MQTWCFFIFLCTNSTKYHEMCWEWRPKYLPTRAGSVLPETDKPTVLTQFFQTRNWFKSDLQQFFKTDQARIRIWKIFRDPKKPEKTRKNPKKPEKTRKTRNRYLSPWVHIFCSINQFFHQINWENVKSFTLTLLMALFLSLFFKRFIPGHPNF